MTGHIRKAGLGTALALASFTAQPALAASGGVSFWLPGIFGSLAAVPVTPGWAYSTIYLHLNEKAGGGQNFVTSGGIPGSVTAGLNAHADALVMGITYTSPMPVLGGQAGFTVLTAPGNIGAGIDATLTASARQYDLGQRHRQPHDADRRVLPGHAEMESGRPQRAGLHHRQHPERHL
ncbi:hypothetical protein ABIF90_000991 [Bradyrhizobium japonicum]